MRRRSADRACYRQSCSRCGQRDRFAPRVRRRGLRLLMEHTVLCVIIWLARWRCRNCRYIFTDYPELSYFPISATLARPSCTWPAATWRRTGSPTVRRPARETERPAISRRGRPLWKNGPAPQHDLVRAEFVGSAIRRAGRGWPIDPGALPCLHLSPLCRFRGAAKVPQSAA